MFTDNILLGELEKRDGIWFGPVGGYWSNLDIEENERYLKDLPAQGARKTVEKYFPQHFDVIFSPKRAGGLPLLDPRPGEVVVDVGCMWGALTISFAMAGCSVVAIDQTLESLRLLQQRLIDDALTNVEVVCLDLKKVRYADSAVDTFVVNGVMEWIPETGTIELKKYYGKKLAKESDYQDRPDILQKDFLQRLYSGLKTDGKLYLAIENRFDFFYFLGLPDPHCNLKFITFLPRKVQNFISNILLGRPYVNWTYSEHALKKMLTDAGFRDISFFYTFPNYRLPEYILSQKGMSFYRPSLYKHGKSFVIKALCYAVEYLVFKILRLTMLSPSFIVIAKK